MNEKTKFRDWLIIANHAGFKFDADAKVDNKPDRIGKYPTPKSFEDMTFGQIVQLSELGEADNMMLAIVNITMGLDYKTAANAPAVDVVKYVLWVTEQLQKVNRLFDKLKSSYTPEELQAGAERLNFGIFGMVDAYARRMGITDHEEVLKTPWMVVYKCMEMDYQTNQYERRLNKIHADKMQRRSK